MVKHTEKNKYQIIKYLFFMAKNPFLRGLTKSLHCPT